MIKIKCDFCDKEILFENIQDVLNDNIRKDIKYYAACQDCGEKIHSLIRNDKFGVITFMNGDKSRDMTGYE